MTFKTNSATFRVLVARISARDLRGFHAAMTLADKVVLIETDEKELTLLHHAAIADNPEIVRTLISKGASEEAKDKSGATPYQLAKRLNKRHALTVLSQPAAEPAPTEQAQPPAAPTAAAERKPKTIRVDASKAGLDAGLVITGRTALA